MGTAYTVAQVLGCSNQDSLHWTLLQMAKGKIVAFMGQDTEVSFAATSDHLPSHPMKKMSVALPSFVGGNHWFS